MKRILPVLLPVCAALFACRASSGGDGDADALFGSWIESVGWSLFFSWCLWDPLVITARNNCFATKGIIRTGYYQTAEKFFVAPVRGAADVMAAFVSA